MADSLNTTNLSRRSILGTGIAAAGALAALGSLPSKAAEADAEITRLYAAYVEAEEREMTLYATWDEARGKAVEAAKIKLPQKGHRTSPTRPSHANRGVGGGDCLSKLKPWASVPSRRHLRMLTMLA